VEGVRADSNADSAEWEAVDCGLYFGGDRLDTARRIELVQLKYSGDPSAAWTTARLCYSTAKSGNNSVLRKLATAYKAAMKAAKRGLDIRVRLVSNQPATESLSDAISSVNSGHSARNALGESFTLVAAATGLRSGELTRFLRSLDLSECGTDSRFVYRERTILAVARLIEGNAASELSELRQHVRDLMLPESVREIVTRDVVLSWFYVHDPSGLFPCPPAFAALNNPITRAASKVLAHLLEKGNRLVVVHGPAGCGKTTCLRQLPSLLPAGSSVMLFDCFGAGRYLAPNDKRHLPANAFLQLGNDLAVGTGTPFFLAREGKRPANIRQFLQRLKDVATTVASKQSNAFLVIAIDAADNAVTAAEQAVPVDPCFIHDLTGVYLTDLPDNVRIVFSARTSRLNGLRLPPHTPEVICSEFTREETAEYVQSNWPDADEPWIDQFHYLSKGIPRVQSYAIKAAGPDQDEALNLLRPAGKGLSDILRLQFDEAEQKHGVRDSFERLNAGLTLLPSPVPPGMLAATVGVATDAVIDVVRDLFPGLSLDGETGLISISDEDFQDFIRRSAEPALDSTRTAATDYLFAKCRTDPYAATHVADFLLEAGRAQDLLLLIEDEDSLDAIVDPIIRREVQLRRLRLALRACRTRADTTDAFKTIVMSADASKGEDALREVLKRETDLAVHFARSSLQRLVLADSDQAAHQGSVLAHDAARAAITGDLITARERLNSYNAWLRQRNALAEQQAWNWRVSIDDLVARAIAILAITNPKTVHADLMNWRPKTLPLEVGLKLIPTLIAAGKQQLVAEALEEGFVAAPWDLLLSVPLALSGHTSTPKQLEDSLRRLNRRHLSTLSLPGYPVSRDSWGQPLVDLVLVACELTTHLGGDPQAILHALSLLRQATYTLATPSSTESVDWTIRIWLLERYLTREASSVESLLEWLTPSNDAESTASANSSQLRVANSLKKEHEELSNKVRAVFPLYEARIGLIGSKPTDIETLIKHIPAKLSDYRFERDWQWHGLRYRAALSIMQLLVLNDLPWRRLFQKACTLLTGEEDNQPARAPASFLELLRMRADAHAEVIRTVAAEARATQERRIASSEKAQELASLSRLLLPLSWHDARALFTDAIQITEDIDYEAHDQIELLNDLAGLCNGLDHDVRRTYATETFRFLIGTAERLGTGESFPWQSGISALARFSQPVALAAVGRWADAGDPDLETMLQPLLLAGLASRDLEPEAAAALGILFEQPKQRLIREFLRAEPTCCLRSTLLNELATDCLLHAKQESRKELGTQITASLGEVDGSSRPAILRLKDTVSFLDSIDTPTVHPEQNGVARWGGVSDTSPAEKPAESDLLGVRFISPDTICQALDTLGNPYGQEAITKRIAHIRAMTEVGDRRGFLISLSEAEYPRLQYSRSIAILDSLSEWSDSPSVQQWCVTELRELLVNRFNEFARWIEIGESKLPELLHAAKLDRAGRLDVITKGVEKHGATINAASLYRVAGLMASDVEDAQVGTLCEWYVERINRRIPVDDKNQIDLTDIPSSTNEALGRLLYALLGDIDTRVRWRTAHTLRRLARLNSTQVLDAVIGNWTRTAERSYRLPEAPHLWLASRLWLVMSLDRIAHEVPDAMVPHLEFLGKIAIDPDFPHVLIREYAKRAALTVADYQTGGLPESRPLSVRRVNQSELRRARKRPTYGRSNGRRATSKHRFHFDTWDTVHYWYEPAAEMFHGLKMEQFLDRAEVWILEKWGAPATASHWASEHRKERYEARGNTWLHSHGELPVLERYATYLEWHAMLCVVGELLETHRLNEYEDRDDNFEGWLDALLPAKVDHWQSDERVPTPLRASMWSPGAGGPNSWPESAEVVEFREELGLDETSHPGFLIVASYRNDRFWQKHQDIGVYTALVSPETASALLRALHTADDPTDFYIPDEGDHREIRTESHQMLGWLAENFDRERFDRRDPLKHDAAPLGRVPGNSVSDLLCLHQQPGASLRWTRLNETEMSFVGESWSDFPETFTSYESLWGSSGWRLWIRARDLQDFLQQRQMDLICEVQIERRIDTDKQESWDPESKRPPILDRVFLLRRDGRIEDATGPIGTWAPPGP
jgi:hypothetical protein